MKETNMEHFRAEAEEKKYSFGKRKDFSTGKEYLISCVGINCCRCDFYTGNNMSDNLNGCEARRLKWLMSEYKEEPVLTRNEKAFVELIEYGWIARDKSGDLSWYSEKPYKSNSWWLHKVEFEDTVEIRADAFPFIMWEDEEPWTTDELRKLKVQDD